MVSIGSLSKFALLRVFREPRRATIALSTIGGGVVALVLAGGFIDWNLWFGRESTIRSQLGHLRIYRPGYLEGGQAVPFRYLLPQTGKELAAVEAMPGVVTVAPRLSFAGLISHGESTLSFLGEGVDPRREAMLSQSLSIVAGGPLGPGDDTGFLLGHGLAANLGVKVGDTVVLLANTPRGGVNAIEGTVRGLFATITKAYDDVAIRVPIEAARRLSRTTGSHHWAVLLERTADTPAQLDAVRAKLDPRSFQVVPWTALADFYHKSAALLSQQMTVMKVLIAVIIVLSISNTMMLNVMERTQEIGTSMALGVTRKAVMSQFVLEGAAMGLLGGAAGLALALTLARIISKIGIPMPPAPGMSLGFTAQIRVTPALALEACIIVVLASLLASAYPAWRASRMQIVDALRHGR